MASDKTIFECPVYTLYTQLDGAQRLVIQPSSGALQDFGVPLSLLAQWLFSNYAIGVTGGTANPDPTVGNNGDLYFQTNGKIYQKTSGGWVLRATMPGYNGFTETVITAGDAQPVTIPHTGTVWPQVLFKKPDGSEYSGATYTDDGTNIIVTGDADSGGGFADSFNVIVAVAGVGGSAPIGAAGGDLTGAYPNPLINLINGISKSFYDPTSSIQTQLDGKQPLLGYTPYNTTNPANYITAAAIPVNVSAFSNDEQYAKIDGTNTLRTSANPGETTSVPDVGHVDNTSSSAETYSAQCWLHIASGGGSVTMELTFEYGGNTFTKQFFLQGSTVAAVSGIDFYTFPSLNVRVDPATTVQVSAIVSGTILYECGCTIELKK